MPRACPFLRKFRMNRINSRSCFPDRMRLALCSCMLGFAGAASAHVADCSRFDGVAQLRCERHVRMADKCGLLKGPAHHACDREFLLANPLNCSVLKEGQRPACDAETKAFKTCEPKQGMEFMSCVKQATGTSPVGH